MLARLVRLLAAVVACGHTAWWDGTSLCYREYRTAEGRPLGVAERLGTAGVLHLVCSRCGKARPVSVRSAQEQAASELVRGIRPRAQRQRPTDVTEFPAPRRGGVRDRRK